jgi:hypothetical protein
MFGNANELTPTFAVLGADAQLEQHSEPTTIAMLTPNRRRL